MPPPIPTVRVHLRSGQFARCAQELGQRLSHAHREHHRNRSRSCSLPAQELFVLSSLWAFNLLNNVGPVMLILVSQMGKLRQGRGACPRGHSQAVPAPRRPRVSRVLRQRLQGVVCSPRLLTHMRQDQVPVSARLPRVSLAVGRRGPRGGRLRPGDIQGGLPVSPPL